MNVTYVEKDKVLSVLCKNLTPEIPQRVNLAEFCSQSGIDSNTLNAILSYFKRIGLVGSFNLRYGLPTFDVLLYTEAFDVFNRGGFTVQEEMLQKEVQKLLLEIERLKPTLGDKIEKITTIGNNIAGIAGGFLGGFISATKSL